MQADEWPDLTDVELRATALDRLDLHYEHQDALSVTRGSWELADYVRRFSDLQVEIGEYETAKEAVDRLMGNKPEERFRFIQERAEFAHDLDI